jgi:hypothetical protein
MTPSSNADFAKHSVPSPHVKALLDQIDQTLLPHLDIESVDSHDPVVVRHIPSPWYLVGAGNYAAVFSHPDYPHQVVKIYAPNRPGFEEEREVYWRLGSHPAFSECFYANENMLILKRLSGITLYDCFHKGVRIPRRVIRDIDRALDYARDRGLYPHDIHARNAMMFQGRGLVVDVSDFLHRDRCSKWEHFKRVYYWLYLPIMAPLRLRIPLSLLDFIRRTYRRVCRLASIQ